MSGLKLEPLNNVCTLVGQRLMRPFGRRSRIDREPLGCLRGMNPLYEPAIKSGQSISCIHVKECALFRYVVPYLLSCPDLRVYFLKP